MVGGRRRDVRPYDVGEDAGLNAEGVSEKVDAEADEDKTAEAE